MNIFFIGLFLNITAGLFNIPLGPERYIKRLYRSLYSIINIDLDDITKKIADTMIYIAVIIYVFVIVWTISEIYNIIPIPFIREAVCSALFCISLRFAQNDNLIAVYMLRHGKKDKVIKRMQKRGFSTEKTDNSNILSDMLLSRSNTVRSIVCPIFFYMCFGLIAAFLYKTTEILSRKNNENWTAKIIYNILSFIPALLFRSIMRISGSVMKGHILSGDSVYKILCSYLGINSENNTVLSDNDIIKSELLIYLSIVLFCFLSYALSFLIGFIKSFI